MKTCNESNDIDHVAHLGNIAALKSLHARKWASIGKRGSLSGTSDGTSNPVSYNVEPPNHVSNILENVDVDDHEARSEPVSTDLAISDTSDSEFELTSRSKRKLSRGPLHDFWGDATKTFNEILVGATGLDISDTEPDSAAYEAADSILRTSNGHPSVNKSTAPEGTVFKRRNTRRVVGPNGEVITPQSKKDTLNRSKQIGCLLDVEAGDQDLLGYLDNVLSSSGNVVQVDGPSTTTTFIIPKTKGVISAQLGGNSRAEQHVVVSGHKEASLLDLDPNMAPPGSHFPEPIMSSTFIDQEKDELEDDQVSLDSSENSVTNSPVERHLSFGSTDLPLFGVNVMPVPRVVHLQNEAGIKQNIDPSTEVLNECTTTYSDSEDMYSSHHSSQNDLINTLLPPIHAQHVKKILRKEEPDFEELERYFPNHQMTLFVGTWNMHSEKDVPLLVEEFLMPPECELVQDMYVIGTQECTPHKREWEVNVQATLGPTHVLVRSESLGDIHLIILVRREMIWIIRDIQSSTVACGAGGVMRNKGAVGIALTIFGSSLLFITSHLRAHTRKLKERNFDSQRIATSLDFSRYCKIQGSDKSDGVDVTDKVDAVFWIGDLNYRITAERSYVEDCIRKNNLSVLLKEDQLLQQMDAKQAFKGFGEAPITFPPTFKFDPGTVDYDTSPKQRVPSWTDRILYKSTQDSITPRIYDYCPGLTFSDHRPVFGVYVVMIKPSPISATIKATGWFDKRAYARGMKRRQLYSANRQSKQNTCMDIKEPSLVKAVHIPVKRVMRGTKRSIVCSIM